VRTIMPSVCLHGGFWSDLDDDARSQSLLPFRFAAAVSTFKVLLILTDKPTLWGRLATARVSAGCGSRRKFRPPPEKPPSAGRIAASIPFSYRDASRCASRARYENGMISTSSKQGGAAHERSGLQRGSVMLFNMQACDQQEVPPEATSDARKKPHPKRSSRVVR